MTRRKAADVFNASPVRIATTVPVALPLVTFDDGIVHVDYSACDGVTLEALQYANTRHRALCPGVKSPVLLTGGRVGTVEYRAQRYGSSPEVCDVVAAAAIVTRSFLERHLANMFLMYHRPPYPTRVFNAEPEARAWLRGYLPQPE